MTHIQQNLMEHFQLACTSFVEMKTERDKLNLQVQELTDQNDKLQKHLREYMEEDDPVVTVSTSYISLIIFLLSLKGQNTRRSMQNPFHCIFLLTFFRRLMTLKSLKA